MSCVYGPYQISSSLPQVEQFSFTDGELPRRVAIFVNCDSVAVPPCSGAVALHIEDGCPESCKIIWYECPEYGRQYTIFPTPCGVMITSFEDGLIQVDDCDATQFGTEHFCFGKIYSSLGEFESPNKASTTFEFDGHTFSVKGKIGECSEIFVCEECELAEEQFFAFEDLPAPPPDPATPDPAGVDDISLDDIPPTEVIPSESRVIWSWPATEIPIGADTLCLPEKSLASWPLGQPPNQCESHDHPATASLPSGHIVVAYENRSEDGSTKITIAILSSSVGQNVQYHRKLGTGTLLNETGGTATFEVFDDMSIPTSETGTPSAGTQIGFLTGPLAGRLITVDTVARTRTGGVIKHTFKFAPGPGVEFPDKNHVYNVEWFLVNAEGSADLPNSENIETVIDMPHFDDAGNRVPVANPSIAIASNNLMTAHEQNVYIAYQAFESNEWRVYLRELILGGSEAVAPIYLSPYLFDENVRQIRIMATAGSFTAMAAGHVFYDENFGQVGSFAGAAIDLLNNWTSLTDSNIPMWTYHALGGFVLSFPTLPFRLCNTQNIQPLFFDTACSNPEDSTCAAVFNAQSCDQIAAADLGNETQVFNYIRSFVVNNTPTIAPGTSGEALNLTFTMRLGMIKNVLGFPNQNFNEMPEVWFLMGLDNQASDVDFGQEGYRLQIRRGSITPDSMAGTTGEPINTCRSSIGSSASVCPSECWIISLYWIKYPKVSSNTIEWWDRNTSTGDQNDFPIRTIWNCDTAGYDTPENGAAMNELRVETYVSGSYRHFDVYISYFAVDGSFDREVQLAAFAEWDETTPFIPNFNFVDGNRHFGKYHGFGMVNAATSKNQCVIDSFKCEQRQSHVADRGQLIFLEDFINRDEFGRSNNAGEDRIDKWSPFFKNDPFSDPGGQGTYDHTKLAFCTDPNADRFYGNVWPSFPDEAVRLHTCNGTQIPPAGSGYWAVTHIWHPSQNFGVETSAEANDHHLDVSLTLSVAREDREHTGAWPQIWFMLRMENPGSFWYSSWRVRIFRFNAVNDYPSLNTPAGISSGDNVWWIQLYDGVSDTGSTSDIPLDEVFLVNGVGLPEWLDIGAGSNVAENPQHQWAWPYFKVDIKDEDGDTVITVRLSDDREGQDTVEDSYATLHTFTVPVVPSNNGTYHGFALFSGSSEESDLGDDGYRAGAALNYVKLATIATPSVVTGACCREVGGCDPDVTINECPSPDEFHAGLSCSEVDCTTNFPVGAVCTTLGVCIDDITEIEASNQGLGTCVDCEWQVNANCSNRNCPAATTLGSCCRPFWVAGIPDCVDSITLEQCQDYYGNSSIPPGAFRLGLTCAQQSCTASNSGTCCFPSGCSITPQTVCVGVGGSWQIHTDCVSDPCPEDGACCDGVGGCTQATQADCVALSVNHIFLGIGVSCTPNPCADIDPIGACCFDDGACTNTIESACTGGTWLYDTTCDDDLCPTFTGCCCNPFNGVCEDGLTESACLDLGHLYEGHGTICAYIDEPIITGACCVGETCIDGLTPQGCAVQGGAYLGNFLNCIDNSCAEGIEDPYSATDIAYKPEDLWVVETAPEEFATRVLYHMQEEITISSVRIGNGGGAVAVADFMFCIDYSNSMGEFIDQVRDAVPSLASNMLSKGIDVRFGLTIFGRGESPPAENPDPGNSVPCQGSVGFCSEMFDGLQSTQFCYSSQNSLDGADGGFTRNVGYLQQSLDCWNVYSGVTQPFSAIQFAIEDTTFNWRDDSAKFMFFVSDVNPECSATICGTYEANHDAALNSLLDNGVQFIPAVTSTDITWGSLSEESGWTGGAYDINSDGYGELFDNVVASIDLTLRVDHASIIERAESGADGTFLKKAEVVITYDGDLSDLWTFNKTDFEFTSDLVPITGTSTKGLKNLPFTLYPGRIYGIDSVHIQGNQSLWVSFSSEGDLVYDHPSVGKRATTISETPVLIATNSARPKVLVNNRNDVIVAYENYTNGIPGINIKGTGDFHQDSIVGPKAERIVRLLNSSDFAYNHNITLPTEGVNQLCDLVIDNSDITHVVWQSSRDGYREIYYANSSNMFSPVRITKSESISSNPSIDVDETGSIFVVYHDDRFGPFNIMLSSKDEERIIPLLEQDAYLASLRSGYNHYTNIIPLLIDNPAVEAPSLGQFWATKLNSGAGNDSENFVYQIDETTGVPSNGFDYSNEELGFKFIVFSSIAPLGIRSDGALYRIGQIGDDNEVVLSEIVSIGIIELDLEPDNNDGWGDGDSTISGMGVDEFDRLWVLIHETKAAGGGPAFSMTPSGLPLVESFAINNRWRLEYVSSSNASTVGSAGVLVNFPDSATGAFAVTADKFYIISEIDGGKYFLSSSTYPSIIEGIAEFDFDGGGIGYIDAFEFDPPVAMTADASGTLWAVTAGNDLYTINKLTSVASFQASLTAGSGDDPSLPVGTTSGITFQNVGSEETNVAQFFHIRVDFYDNLALEGSPFISIDSRDNLEAFINEEVLDDPYLDPYAPTGMDARGIFLEPGEIGVVFFDATNFVPGFSRLSQPYSFEPNQTYFPRTFAINETGHPRETTILTTNSFSCSKCSRFGNNNFNTSSCSYSFIIRNNEFLNHYNFQIDFYADSAKQHIIRRFEATPGSDDLQYMEVDNKPAIGAWNEFGLPIFPDDVAFIQIHPVLDPAAGFLCGVTYTVQVNSCRDSGEICTNFTEVNPSNWFSTTVGGEGAETIADVFGESNIVQLGLSMKSINEKISIVWRTPQGSLKYAEFDGEWTTQTVFSDNINIYCDLAEINGKPSISRIIFNSVFDYTSDVSTLENGTWNTWPTFNDFRASNAAGTPVMNPKSLLEFDNAPMTTQISIGGIGQPSFLLNSGRTRIWDVDPACFPPFGTLSGGSCTTTLATINGLPAVAWQALNGVRYASWDSDNLTFGNVTNVSAGDTGNSVPGRVALVDVDGQPAVAYLEAIGSNARLKYKRFDGNTWVNTPTNGQIYNFNSNVAMTVISGQPHIAYSIKTSPTTSQLRYAFHNGSKFVDELIEDGLNQVNHLVGIVEYLNQPAVTISANPFRVYFFRQQPSQSADEIRPIFFCECSSKIFTNRLTHLNEVSRWESSAHGFSDTLVTDSAANSILPVIQTRSTGATVVIWEDSNISENCSDPPCIRAATYRNTNQDQLRGSGTQSWFDYDFGISGKNPNLTLDLYDRVNSIYEKLKSPGETGFHGKHLNPKGLPGNELYAKVCDFSVSEAGGGIGVDPEKGCDLSSLESNIISHDPFISEKIVRKIRVKDEFVEYYTYNASEKITPIVSTCNIALEIHGTPEVVALRFKNEDTIVWSSWCPWSPQIGDFVMEKEYVISKGSGIKEVCIQAMTYSGITTEFCLPIVADYETIVFESRFYRNTDADGTPITDFIDGPIVDGNVSFTSNDSKLVTLPLSDGISVASILPEGGVSQCVNSSDCEDDEICIGGRCVAKTATILIEIVPSKEPDAATISFDVVQQGTNDTSGLVATKGTNQEGKVVYRGVFTIQREDNVSNVDGLARISPAFPGSCDAAGFREQAANTYTRDTFNKITTNAEVEESGTVDPLVDYRQTASGRVGATVDIRSAEDPYFIFGDPNYSLKKTDGRRQGVPFQIAEIEVITGEAPPEPETCEEKWEAEGDTDSVRLTDEQCQQETGNPASEWLDSPNCSCSDPVA